MIWVHRCNSQTLRKAYRCGILFDMRKIPLHKCLQCHAMKREDFHDRCQACYDENEADIVRQIESGVKIPIDRNLIGWVYHTSQPELHDYLWYFLKWCFSHHPRANRARVKDEYEAASMTTDTMLYYE